jgi:hypothetical protein
MTDRDNITLPREVVQEAVKALEFAERNHDGEQSLYTTEIAALRKALAAEQQEPVAYFDLQKQVFYWARPTMIDVPMTIALEPLPLYAAPPEPDAKREPVAFTRKEWSPDCGEYVEFRTVEEMKFYDRTDWTPLYAAPPKPDAKREPATREQVAEAYKASESDGGEVIYCEAWRDAERFHGIRGSK